MKRLYVFLGKSLVIHVNVKLISLNVFKDFIGYNREKELRRLLRLYLSELDKIIIAERNKGYVFKIFK